MAIGIEYKKLVDGDFETTSPWAFGERLRKIVTDKERFSDDDRKLMVVTDTDFMSMPALVPWMMKWNTADKHQTQGVYGLAFKKGNLADSAGSLVPWAFLSYMIGRRCLESDILLLVLLSAG